jgi:hypothetical protein
MANPVYDSRRERSRLYFALRYSAICGVQFQYFSKRENPKLPDWRGVSAVGCRNEFITDVQKTRCHGADDEHVYHARFDGGDIRRQRRLAKSHEGVLSNEESFAMRIAWNCHPRLRIGA